MVFNRSFLHSKKSDPFLLHAGTLLLWLSWLGKPVKKCVCLVPSSGGNAGETFKGKEEKSCQLFEVGAKIIRAAIVLWGKKMRNSCLQAVQRLFQGSLFLAPIEISKLPRTEMPFNNTDHQA